MDAYTVREFDSEDYKATKQALENMVSLGIITPDELQRKLYLLRVHALGKKR